MHNWHAIRRDNSNVCVGRPTVLCTHGCKRRRVKNTPAASKKRPVSFVRSRLSRTLSTVGHDPNQRHPTPSSVCVCDPRWARAVGNSPSSLSYGSENSTAGLLQSSVGPFCFSLRPPGVHLSVCPSPRRRAPTYSSRRHTSAPERSECSLAGVCPLKTVCLAPSLGDARRCAQVAAVWE